MDCELKNLHFIDAAFCDGKLLFYNRETKFFYSYDFTSETIGFIEVNGVDEFDMDVPRKVIRNKKFIYFIQSDTCVIYKFEQIDTGLVFRKKIIVEKFEGNVKNAFIFHGVIWIIPSSLSAPMAKIDLKEDSVEYSGFYSDNYKENDGAIRDITLDNGMLYFTFEEREELAIYNLCERTFNIYKTGIGSSIEGIVIRDSNIILREKYGKRIYCWNSESEKCQLLATSEQEFEELGKLRLLSDGTIIICPILKNSFFYVNELDGIIQSVQANEELNRINDGTFTIETLEYEDALYVYPWAGESIVKIYRDGQHVKADKVYFRMNKKEYADYYYNHKTKESIEEHDNFSLKELLERI